MSLLNNISEMWHRP